LAPLSLSLQGSLSTGKLPRPGLFLKRCCESDTAAPGGHAPATTAGGRRGTVLWKACFAERGGAAGGAKHREAGGSMAPRPVGLQRRLKRNWEQILALRVRGAQEARRGRAQVAQWFRDDNSCVCEGADAAIVRMTIPPRGEHPPQNAEATTPRPFPAFQCPSWSVPCRAPPAKCWHADPFPGLPCK
jgi:hypothetical protein